MIVVFIERHIVSKTCINGRQHSVGKACGGSARPVAMAAWHAKSHEHGHGLSPN